MNVKDFNLKDYISINDGRLLTQKAKHDGYYDNLMKKYPWCKSFKELVYYEENKLTSQKTCKYKDCNKHIKYNNTFCSTSCGTKQQMIDGNSPFADGSCNKGKTPWNKGKDTKHLHVKYTNPEKWEIAKLNISLANSGENNGMYKWGETHPNAENIKLKCSETTKLSILEGRFTPNTNNRHTHFESTYNGKKYRSSWEAAFHSINPHLEFEKVRIKYFDKTTNSTRIYITDFVDAKNKIIYEIRPNELFNKTSCKIQYAVEFCKLNKYKYMHIDIDYLYDNRDKINNLDENSIRKLNHAFKVYQRNI